MPHRTVPEFQREFQKDSSLGPRTMFFVHLPYHFIFQCVLNYSFKFKWSSPTARILQVKCPFSLKSDCLEINKKNELKLNFRFRLKEDKKIKPASTNSIFDCNGWDQNTFLENKNQKWYSVSLIYEVCIFLKLQLWNGQFLPMWLLNFYVDFFPVQHWSSSS